MTPSETKAVIDLAHKTMDIVKWEVVFKDETFRIVPKHNEKGDFYTYSIVIKTNDGKDKWINNVKLSKNASKQIVRLDKDDKFNTTPSDIKVKFAGIPTKTKTYVGKDGKTHEVKEFVICDIESITFPSKTEKKTSATDYFSNITDEDLPF